jgi:RNA polymerase sigma-70 factor (ECF subfamily)
VNAELVAQLFEEHHASLFRYLARLSGDADLAADAAQEAFVRLIEGNGRAGASAPRAWLFTVGTNLVLEGGRTRTRRARLLEGAPGRAPIGDPPLDAQAHLEGEERRRVVSVALLALSGKERTALLMQQEGFSHREIADTVGTTTGSVGTLLARALDKLASALPLDSNHL